MIPALSLLAFGLLGFVVYRLATRSARVLARYRARHGLEAPTPDNVGLQARVTEALGASGNSEFQRILRLPIEPEAWLVQRRSAASRSKNVHRAEQPWLLVCFGAFALEGRLFVTEHTPLGAFGAQLIEAALSHVFGLDDLSILTLERDHPLFEQVTPLAQDAPSALALLSRAGVADALTRGRPSRARDGAVALTPQMVGVELPGLSSVEDLEAQIAFIAQLHEAASRA